MPGRMGDRPFPWIQRHVKLTQWGGYFPSSIKTIDYVKKKNVKSNAISDVR